MNNRVVLLKRIRVKPIRAAGPAKSPVTSMKRPAKLIALAVAITLRCDGCITVHTAAARERARPKSRSPKRLGVAVSVNAGVAVVYSTRALDAFDAAAELNA